MGTSKQLAMRDEEFTSELPFHRPRILVAEEDHETRWMIAAALRSDGYEVTAVKNGFELLDHLSDALLVGLPTEGPDGIIMDMWMPGVSGLSILGGLRDAGWQTPVVLITESAGCELRGKPERLGADAVFEKPFDIDDLRTILLNLILYAPQSFVGRITPPPPQRDGPENVATRIR